MKLKKELKKSLGSNLYNKIIACALIILIPLTTMANPTFAERVIPPGSATYVEDKIILDQLGLGGPGAYCYDHQANSILITAAARTQVRCDLHLQYELEKEKIKHGFEVDKLQVRIDILTKQHKEINLIKDKEITRLTEAALKRPNDYRIWWGVGGFVTGTALTVLIGWLALSAQGGS